MVVRNTAATVEAESYSLFRRSIWGFITLESNSDRSIAGSIITVPSGRSCGAPLHTGGPFVIFSVQSWKSRGKERKRRTGRTVVLRIVHGVIRHGRELTTTTFHPNHVIDVRDARFFSPISRYLSGVIRRYRIPSRPHSRKPSSSISYTGLSRYRTST